MEYLLGIDCGTTKVAAVLLEASTLKLVACAAQESGASVPRLPGFAEQDPMKIGEAVRSCLSRLPAKMRAGVRAVGFTGQMHGVVCWKSSTWECSSLITWQDERCLRNGFLSELQQRTGERALRSGFGCASLAWLGQNEPGVLGLYDCAATIHDYLACRCVGRRRAATDPTDAASFGCFDLLEGAWKIAAIESCIPLRVLPEIVPTGSVLGPLTQAVAAEWGLPPGVPVTAPLGDNQASMFATLTRPESDVGITIGTGAQVAVIVNDARRVAGRLPESAEVRPYVSGHYAIVGASLCGGSAWAWLAETLLGWLSELGVAPPKKDALYKALNDAGMGCKESPLRFKPHFMGERHDLELRGEISGLDLHNGRLGNVAAALARGIVENLRGMLPSESLEGRTRVVGSGNALRRNRLLQEMTREVFELPLELPEMEEEAARGAAMLARRAVAA